MQRWALGFTFAVFLLLILFEKPNGTLHTLQPFALTFTVEMLCYVHFCYRLWEYRQITPRDQFWKEGKVIVVVASMILTIADTIIFIALDQAPDNHYTRLSRVLRPLFVINLSPSRLIRQGFRSVRRTMIQVVDVLALLFITIGVFTILFVKLYGNRHNLIDADNKRFALRLVPPRFLRARVSAQPR